MEHLVVLGRVEAAAPSLLRQLRELRGSEAEVRLHDADEERAVLDTQDEGTAAQDTVVFFFNFFDYLRQIAPGTR